jgi:hypothetical protein
MAYIQGLDRHWIYFGHVSHPIYIQVLDIGCIILISQNISSVLGSVWIMGTGYYFKFCLSIQYPGGVYTLDSTDFPINIQTIIISWIL